MRRIAAALGSGAFLVLAPGMMGGLVPFLLTGWVVHDPPVVVFALGALLLVGGAALVLHAFARFVIEGAGTPAPVAPTGRLVVGGLYRHVRNPMYLAATGTIVGQALLLGQYWLSPTRRCFSRPRWRSSPSTRSRRYVGSSARNTTRIALPFPAGCRGYARGAGNTKLPTHRRRRTSSRRSDAFGRRAGPGCGS